MILLRRIWNFLTNQNELLNDTAVHALSQRTFSEEKTEELRQMYFITAETGNTPMEEIFSWMNKAFRDISSDIQVEQLRYLWKIRYRISLLNYNEFLLWTKHLGELDSNLTVAGNELLNKIVRKVQVTYLEEKLLERLNFSLTSTDKKLVH